MSEANETAASPTSEHPIVPLPALEWRPVVGFESTHRVSRCGKVKAIERTFITSNGHVRRYRERMHVQNKNSNGYMRCNLSIGGVSVGVSVHKMVAEAFCEKPNTNEVLVVNHIDHDKTNNHASNLEWVTYSGNMKASREFYRNAKQSRQELF